MVEQARRWSERQEPGEVALRTEMMQLTLGIIAQTMFGSGEEDAGEEVREFLNAALALFTPFTFPFARVLERLPLPRPVASFGRGPVWTAESIASSSKSDRPRETRRISCRFFSRPAMWRATEAG